MFVIYNTRIHRIISKLYSSKEKADKSMKTRIKDGARAEDLEVCETYYYDEKPTDLEKLERKIKLEHAEIRMKEYLLNKKAEDHASYTSFVVWRTYKEAFLHGYKHGQEDTEKK